MLTEFSSFNLIKIWRLEVKGREKNYWQKNKNINEVLMLIVIVIKYNSVHVSNTQLRAKKVVGKQGYTFVSSNKSIYVISINILASLI